MNTFLLNFAYLLFISYVCAVAATEAAQSESCQAPDSRDQAILMEDFGQNGVRGHFNVTLTNSLQPGAVISVVTKSETRGSINLIADDIYVLHVDARIQLKQLVLATSKRLNLEWHEVVSLPNPVVKNSKTTTTLVYDISGFQVYINGKKVAFYVHKTNKIPRVLTLAHDFVYKILYLTTTETGEV